jgi:hypothetical protein
MKYGKYLALMAALAFLLSSAAFAKTKDEGSMQLTDRAQVGSTQLKPGSYKVEWNGTGNQVNVDILRHGKTIATVPAKLVQHANPSPYNAVVTDPGKNQVAHVREIDFSNRREALVLMPQGMMSNGMSKK